MSQRFTVLSVLVFEKWHFPTACLHQKNCRSPSFLQKLAWVLIQKTALKSLVLGVETHATRLAKLVTVFIETRALTSKA